MCASLMFGLLLKQTALESSSHSLPIPYPHSGMFTPLDLLHAFLWGSGWEGIGNSAQTEAYSALLPEELTW